MLNNRILRVFGAIAMMILLSPVTLWGQNLITNGDFESTSFDYQTLSDYERIWSGAVHEGKFIHDVNSTGHGPGDLGWPSNLKGYGDTGYYLLFNGFGEDQNPTKVVWHQTVTVTPNTIYIFSAQIRNLAQSIFGFSPNPAILRLKINGQQVGSDLTLTQQHNNWYEWSNTWNSGSETQANIEIFDVFTGEGWTGDDFGIDHLSFVPQATYSVDAVDDDVPLCVEYYQTYQIDVLANDIITPSDQISGATVQVIQNATHGNAIWNNSTRKIHYQFLDQGYYGGLDQIKYRVTIPHGESSDAWVYVNTGRTPNVVDWIDSPGPICAGGPLGIPVPSVEPDQGSGQWVCSQTQNGTYTSFDANNVPLSMNGWYVKFKATNDCGDGYSNTVQITVIDIPTVGSILDIIPSTVCSPVVFSSYNLPTIQPNGSNPDPATSGWQIQPIGGQWGNAPSTILYQPNGNNVYNIRYCADNDCGPSYSNTLQLTVIDKPTVESISDIIPSLICAPATFSFNPPTVQPNGSSLNPATSGWQIQPIGGQWGNAPSTIQYQPDGNNVYNVRYCADNDCGPSYSNTVQITVSTAPNVTDITAPAGICEGLTLTLSQPQFTPSDATGCWQVFLDGIWQDITGNSIPSISYNVYNGCLIRYKAINDCGDDFSNAVSITVYPTEPIDEGELAACAPMYHYDVYCNHTADYSTQITTPEGCQRTVSWHFTLGDAYVAPVQYETECNSYYWNKTNRTYYETGIYDTIIISNDPQICDSTFTLNLTINHMPVITEQLESPNPIEVCSSIGILNVTAPSFENGGTAGWEYATSEYGPWNNEFNPASFNLEYGSYWLRYVVDNDCADVPVTSNPVPFYVSEAPTVSIVGGQQLHDLEVCDGEVIDWPQVLVEWKCQPNGLHIRRWEKASEQYGTYAPFDTAAVISNDCWIRYYVQNSCGEVILGPVHVSVVSVQDEWQSHEDCDMVEFEGVQYVEDTVVNVMVNEPCPHTIHHNIIVHHSEYTMEPIPQTTCHDEFVWHGHIYYRSDGLEQLMHFDTVTEYGCIKTLEQQLVFDDYSTKIESQKACGIFYWPRNDSTYVYDENQMHIQDSWFIPGDGVVCDSIIYLSLDLGRDYELEGEPIEPQCYGFEWHGVQYFEDAIVYDSLKTTVTQCDSIIFYHLTIVQPSDTTVVEMENCKPVWWQDHLFEEDGEEFTATLISSLTGCDSIVTMHFSLTPEIEKQLDTLACEAFLWYDHYFSENDQASHAFLTSDGCDSTVYLNVTFIQPDIQLDEPLSACNSYTFQGVTYGPGIYEIPHDTVFAQNGCISSVQLLNLTVKDSEQLGTISGASNVYVASSLINGIYRYEIDTEGLAGPVTWSLSNPDWQILEQGDGFCRVLVTTPGSVILTARFNVEECGEMERTFEILAGFFGVDDNLNEVRIFPNPTNGKVTIEAEGIESLRLIDMMGQMLETRECDGSDSVELNLGSYIPSVYLLEVKTIYGIVKKRIILCR